MTMSAKTLDVSQVYHTASVTTRAAAEQISRMIADCVEDRVVLDFGGIEFTTLSFLDQFNHEIGIQLGKTVEIANMNDNVRGLQQVIERRRIAG